MPDRAAGPPNAEQPKAAKRSGSIKIGTCSWTDPTLLSSGWYPAKVAKQADLRLRFYAERFPVVENDATYYALPDPKQAQLWTERTPEGFTMDFKAFGAITTHPVDAKRLPRDIRESLPPAAQQKPRLYPKDVPPDVRDEIHARFWIALEPLRTAGKLGAILLQYPDWFVMSHQNKDEILHARERLPDDRLAIEFRNETWMSERNRAETLRFLTDHDLTYVAVDEPQGFPSSVPPVAAVTSDRLAIVRFHGRNAESWKKKGLSAAERFNYSYSAEELGEWVGKIGRLAEESAEVHVLMNNCYGDKAVNNAQDIGRLLHQRPT